MKYLSIFFVFLAMVLSLAGAQGGQHMSDEEAKRFFEQQEENTPEFQQYTQQQRYLEYLQQVQRLRTQQQLATHPSQAQNSKEFNTSISLKNQNYQMWDQYRQNMGSISRREFRDIYGHTYQQRGCYDSTSSRCRY